MSERLTRIDSQHWPKIRQKFLLNWPENAMGYYTVDNFINWKKLDPNYDDCVFYSLDGDWSDGTVLILDGRQVFAYTLAQSTERLGVLFDLLPKDRSYFAASMEARFADAMRRIIDSFPNNVLLEGSAKLFRLPKEEAIKLELSIPSGLSLSSLNDVDLDQINAIYPLKTDRTPYYFNKLWKYNINRGVFDDQGRLLAWSFRAQTGMIAALQTQDFARKRGLAELVTRAISIEIAKSGDDCIALIVEENIPSISLFQKLGYKYTGEKAHWILFEPKTESLPCPQSYMNQSSTLYNLNEIKK